MLANAVMLIVLILIFPLKCSSEVSLISKTTEVDDVGNITASDINAKPARPCTEMGDRFILNFEVSNKSYSVVLKPHDSLLNPFKSVRVFNGYVNEARTFFPCLVRGYTFKDGQTIKVYGNILDRSFNGFAILNNGMHHIRQASLEGAKHQIRHLQASDDPSFFLSGLQLMEPAVNSKVTEKPLQNPKTPRAKKPAEKPTSKDLWNLYAKDCVLKLVADHTFHRTYGGGDVGLTLSYMTYFIQEVDSMFRAVDFGNSGLPNQIGFRVKDVMVFEDHLSLTSYPLHDERMTSTNLLRQIAALKDPSVCYVLLFSYRKFSENNLGKSYSWNGPTVGGNTSAGGICAADAKNGRLPNVGFVSMRLGGEKLPANVSVLAVARVLAMAFGSKINMDTSSCPTNPEQTNVMDKYFPPKKTDWQWIKRPGLSSCSIKDMKQVMSRRANCFVSVVPFLENTAPEDFEYYFVSRAIRSHGIFKSWLTLVFGLLYMLLKFL